MAADTYRGPLESALVICGLLSSALYVIIDVVGALSYPGYDYFAQAISEMSAIGAPTTSLLAPFYRAWSVLFLGFTAGVWRSGRTRHALRWSAGFMVALAVVGLGFSVFPMNQRSAEPTSSDTMHLLIGGATMLLLAGAILAGADAFGRRFRLYSKGSVAVMLLFFGLTVWDVPKVGADLPTPFMGLNERISMGAWLLWIAVLSVLLLRNGAQRPSSSAP